MTRVSWLSFTQKKEVEVTALSMMRTHMQKYRSAQCYCSSRPLATVETDNSVRPRDGEKLSPALRMPATITIEPSEGTGSGHTHINTLLFQRGVCLDGFSLD